jgi:hypothetical protein
MDWNRKHNVVLLVAATCMSLALSPLIVAGQSTGVIQAGSDSGELMLEESESRIIEITYASPANGNPTVIGFTAKYNPDVVSVTNVNNGEYITPGFTVAESLRDDSVVFDRVQSDGEPVEKDEGTVATITVELADGVNKGETTNIEFTRVDVKPDKLGEPEKINKTITAAEGTEDTPQNSPNYDVEIRNPTISGKAIGETPSEQTLSFDVANISTDNKKDNFAVTIPNNVSVKDVSKTTVTDASDNKVTVSNDPADEDNPGRELKFTVNPYSEETKVKTLSVKVEMELSASP